MLTRYRNQTASHPFGELMNGLIGRDISQFMGHDDVPQTAPKVNITGSPKDYSLELMVPGFSKDRIQISMEENLLTIKGEKESASTQDEERYLRREFSTTSFTRSFRLPETVNVEAITAEVTDGILRITVPKADPIKPEARKIAIS